MLVILSPVSIWSQSGDMIVETFDDAEFFYARGEYEEAAYYYRQLVTYSPANANYHFKLGECYLNIPGSEILAVPHLEKAKDNIIEKKKYRAKDFTEDRAPLHAFFYLGNAYRINNQLSEALEAYNTFVSSPFYYGNYNVAIVENEIKSCERAKIIQDHPIQMTGILLDSTINTSASELNPVISSDEQEIFFVRRLKFYDAVYTSVRKEGTWTDPVNLNPFIGSDGDFYPACISPDKRALYLIKKDVTNSDIYVSYRVDSVWTGVQKLNKKINSKANETSAWISEDGETLFFSSSRRRGVGGKDIYYAIRKKNGEWGRVRNIGKTINTPFDEEGPCLTNQGNTLYFSSKGHYNMGGFDIFFSNRNGDAWGEPVNAGYPLNDTGDNTGYTALMGGMTGYYSKMNMTGTSGEDIYRVVIRTNLPRIMETIESMQQ
ncbi:MAG: PD40 domain-containing protein [Bacteroidales bacterium]|nr:PD40 domain-containing protein [Bacteroidales bacterium]